MRVRTSELLCLGAGLAAGVALGMSVPYLRRTVLPKLVAPGGVLSSVYAVVAEKVAMEIEKLQDDAAATAATVPPHPQAPEQAA